MGNHAGDNGETELGKLLYKAFYLCPGVFGEILILHHSTLVKYSGFHAGITNIEHQVHCSTKLKLSGAANFFRAGNYQSFFNRGFLLD
jgi:hypothetical protein